MKLTDPKHPWQRLVAIARTADSDGDSAAPYGFASRVSALAFAQMRPVPSLFELFAPRAFLVACLLMLASLAVNYSVLVASDSDVEPTILDSQPAVALLLDES